MLGWVRRLCLGPKACNVPLPTLGVVMIHIFVIALLCVLILYVVYTYLPMDGALKKHPWGYLGSSSSTSWLSV